MKFKSETIEYHPPKLPILWNVRILSPLYFNFIKDSWFVILFDTL